MLACQERAETWTHNRKLPIGTTEHALATRHGHRRRLGRTGRSDADDKGESLIARSWQLSSRSLSLAACVNIGTFGRVPACVLIISTAH